MACVVDAAVGNGAYSSSRAGGSTVDYCQYSLAVVLGKYRQHVFGVPSTSAANCNPHAIFFVSCFRVKRVVGATPIDCSPVVLVGTPTPPSPCSHPGLIPFGPLLPLE